MMAASTDRFADDTFISSASLDERNFYQHATWKNVNICLSAQRQTTLWVSILPSEISQIQIRTHSFICVGGWGLGGRARFQCQQLFWLLSQQPAASAGCIFPAVPAVDHMFTVTPPLLLCHSVASSQRCSCGTSVSVGLNDIPILRITCIPTY